MMCAFPCVLLGTISLSVIQSSVTAILSKISFANLKELIITKCHHLGHDFLPLQGAADSRAVVLILLIDALVLRDLIWRGLELFSFPASLLGWQRCSRRRRHPFGVCCGQILMEMKFSKGFSKLVPGLEPAKPRHALCTEVSSVAGSPP